MKNKLCYINNLGNEFDAVLLEELLFQKYKNFISIEVDYKKLTLSIDYEKRFPSIKTINTYLFDFGGVLLSEEKEDSKDKLIKKLGNGQFQVNIDALKIWVIAIVMTIGLLLITSAIVDFYESGVNREFDSSYKILTLVSFLIIALFAVISSVSNKYLFIEKIFNNSFNPESISTFLLRMLGRFISLFFLYLVFGILGNRFNSDLTLLSVVLIFSLFLSSIVVLGFVRGINDYKVTTVLRDLKIKQSEVNSLAKGILSVFTLNPFLIIYIMIFFILGDIKSSRPLFLVYSGIEILTLLSFYIVQRKKNNYSFKINSSFFTKVLGLFFLFISTRLLSYIIMSI